MPRGGARHRHHDSHARGPECLWNQHRTRAIGARSAGRGRYAEISFAFRAELCPGDYTLTAASHDPDGVWHDWLEDAVAFSVTDERYTAGRGESPRDCYVDSCVIDRDPFTLALDGSIRQIPEPIGLSNEAFECPVQCRRAMSSLCALVTITLVSGLKRLASSKTSQLGVPGRVTSSKRISNGALLRSDTVQRRGPIRSLKYGIARFAEHLRRQPAVADLRPPLPGW